MSCLGMADVIKAHADDKNEPKNKYAESNKNDKLQKFKVVNTLKNLDLA